MSDFQVPTTYSIPAHERCHNCSSVHSQIIHDLSKCLDCGATWVTGSGIPVSPRPSLADLLYQAWGVIANVSEGDWTQQPEQWQEAATRWRDQWHATLPPGTQHLLPQGKQTSPDSAAAPGA